MDKNIKHKIVVIFLIACILLSGYLYVKSLHLKSELGVNYYNSFGTMHFEVGGAIKGMEDDIDPSITRYDINNIYVLDGFFSISQPTKLYFSEIFNGKIDFTRLENDSSYKNEVITQLKAYHNALTNILNDIEKYKEKHKVTRFKDIEVFVTDQNSVSSLLRISSSVAYYDYFSQKPNDTKKFRSKIHELIYTEIKY